MLGRLTELPPAGPRATSHALRNSLPVGVPSKSCQSRLSVFCSAHNERPEEASQTRSSDSAEDSGKWFSGIKSLGLALKNFISSRADSSEPNASPEDAAIIRDLSEELCVRESQLKEEIDKDEEVKKKLERCLPAAQAYRVYYPKDSSTAYVNPSVLQLPGPINDRRKQLDARFRKKWGIPFPRLNDKEKAYILHLLFAASYGHPELCFLVSNGITDSYAAYATWQFMIKHGAVRASDLDLVEPRAVLLREDLVARRRAKKSARKDSLKKLPPKKGFGSSKPVKQEVRGLKLDDLQMDDQDRAEYKEKMTKQYEKVADALHMTEDYVEVLVEGSTLTQHLLKLGILVWAAKQEVNLWYEPSAIAILNGSNQAARGKWKPEWWQEKGLIPNYEDVVDDLELLEGEMVAEFCLESEGITGEPAAALMRMMDIRKIAEAEEELLVSVSEIYQLLLWAAVAMAAKAAFGERGTEEISCDKKILMEYLETEFAYWEGDRMAKAPPHVRLAYDSYSRSVPEMQEVAARETALRVAAQAIAAAAAKRIEALEAEAAAAEAAAQEAAEIAAQQAAEQAAQEAAEKAVLEQAAAAKEAAEREARRQEEAQPSAQEQVSEASASLTEEAAAEAAAQPSQQPQPSVAQEDISSQQRAGETLRLQPSTSGRSATKSSGTLSGRVGLRRPMRWRDAVEASKNEVSYIHKELSPEDRRAYKAAGVIPYMFLPDDTLVVLVAYAPNQFYDGADGYTFLGGKRNLFDASAEATAVRELAEETAGLLSGYDVTADKLGPVLWYPKGLYVAYLQELGPEYKDLPERYAQRTRKVRRHGQSEPISLAWLDVGKLEQCRREAQPYLSFFMRIIRQTGLVSWLKERQSRPYRRPANVRRRPLSDRLPGSQRLRGSMADFAAEYKSSPPSTGNNLFWWSGGEAEAEAGGDDSALDDGLGVSLELLMGRNAGMGTLTEQWNNGGVLVGPGRSQRGPLYKIRPTIPGGASTVRIFQFMPDGLMHESEEDTKPGPWDWSSPRSTASLTSSLLGASSAYLPAGVRVAPAPDLRATATLTPASTACSLPVEKAGPLTRPRVREREHVHVWRHGRLTDSGPCDTSESSQGAKRPLAEAIRPRPFPAMAGATASPTRPGRTTPRRRRRRSGAKS